MFVLMMVREASDSGTRYKMASESLISRLGSPGFDTLPVPLSSLRLRRAKTLLDVASL